MRAFAFAIAAGVFFALPLPASATPLSIDLSSQSIEVGPGGVRVGHDRYGSRRRDREPRGGGRCAELRRACLNKDRLGEQGEGNCRRYRAQCR
jgi:hypothetical protein